MRGLLVVAALTLLQACGASNAPDAPGPGAGGHDPDSGVPGPASLTVSPASQRVLAGSAAIALQATLVGDELPIGWLLIGPGTLGATAGAQTTYTPPASVDAETVVTVLASAGPGLTAAAMITVAPSAAMTVTGRVVGPTGVALSGLTVGIAGKSAVTGADGRFSIPGVVPPYDLNVVLADARVLVGRYEGLTRPDPTLVFLFLFTTGEPNTATISGTVSGGDEIGTAGEFTAAIFTTTDVRFDFTAIGVTPRNNPFTLPVSWFGPESITGAVHVLQFKTPGVGQPPTEYTGYGVHDGLSIGRGAAVEDAGVTLAVPRTASIGGTVVPPEGYTVLSKSLTVELAGLTAVPLGHVDTADTVFAFAVPEGIDSTSAVTASAQKLGGGTTLRRVSGIAPRQADVSLVLPSPGLQVAPADGATGVSDATIFSWTPLEHGVHVLVFEGEGASDPEIYVVTAGTSTRVPGFPGGSRYHWLVGGFGPFDTVDAFTGGANLFRTLGDEFQTVSESRTFEVE